MSRKVLLGTSLVAALFFMIVGAMFWASFNTAMEASNSVEFCISCHEMEENIFHAYQKSIHYTNRSGVRAACSDCHVPRKWIHKVRRKIHASNEVFHKILGSIDTPEKYDKKRLQMAKNVWQSMKNTDSRECRNCHNFDFMNPQEQKKRSRKQHATAMENGNTCIDCHKGIAHGKFHNLLSAEELEEISRPNPENKRPIAPQWQAFIDNGKKLVTANDSKEGAVKTEAATATADKAEPTAAAKPAVSGGSNIDWNGIEAREVTLFYPGQASLEWILNGSEHAGKPDFTTGNRCFDCHEGEEVDFGEKIVSGEKFEPTPIPGKRGSIMLNVKAAHDADNLYILFQWQDGEHADIPFADDGKMDAENPIKLAIMLTTDSEDDHKVEFADRAGCWQSCHHDLNYMPDKADDAALNGPLSKRLDLSAGFTKYLKESRSEIEIEGKAGKKRGGWDKLKEEAEIQTLLENGSFMDLLRYKSGTGESEDGYILAERVMTGGQGVNFTGELKDGIWTVELIKKLTSDKAGDISMELDQWYNIGFAIHDDYSKGRFHHVSLGLKLAFDDDEAEINAIEK